MISHTVSIGESVHFDNSVFSEAYSATPSTACVDCILDVITQFIDDKLRHDFSVEVKAVSTSYDVRLLVSFRILKLNEDVLKVTISVYFAFWDRC